MKRAWAASRQAGPWLYSSRASQNCPTCTASARAAFHASSTRSFAFKWFKQSSAQSKQRDRWLQVLARRKGGALSHQEVAFMLEAVDRIALEEGELTESIQAALRMHGEEHDQLATQLYGLLQQKREVQVTRSLATAGLEDCLPQLVAALASTSNETAALQLCAAAENLPDSAQLWRILLQSLADQANLARFLEVRDYMLLHRIPLDAEIVNLQLELLNTQGLFQDAIVLYATMDELQIAPITATKLLVLDSCMRAGNPKMGQSIAEQLKRDASDSVHRKLLAWSVFTGESINDVCKQAAARPVDLSTLNAMMSAAGLAQRSDAIDELWTAFAYHPDLFPNETTYGMRIVASVTLANLPQAKRIFAEAEKSGFAEMLDSEALQVLLVADLNSTDADAAFNQQLLDILVKREPFPIAQSTLPVLIAKLVERKQFMQLESILEQSRQRPDWALEDTIQAILAQVAVAADGKQVWNLSILLRNLFWDDPVYSLELRNLLLKRLIQLQDTDKLARMFRQFFQSQIKPDVGMYTLMLHGGQDLNDINLIRQIHASIKMDVNLSEHTRILTTLMRAYAHVAAAETFDVWNQIFLGGRGPTPVSVSVVMDACAHMRMPTRGLFIWQALERRGFVFNDNNYASLVEVYTRNGNPAGVLPLLEEALQNKGDVGPRTLSTLWNTARGMRTQTEAWARKHCPELWQQLKP